MVGSSSALWLWAGGGPGRLPTAGGRRWVKQALGAAKFLLPQVVERFAWDVANGTSAVRMRIARVVQ